MTELESYLNVTNNLINDLVRKGNSRICEASMGAINGNIEKEYYEVNNKLNKLHTYRKEIIKLIENKLDETFNRKYEE